MGGTKQKVGKARKDKWYNLAKETGFRARSAFKLVQLNRRYNFLQSSRVCIDLCAAPGGWMQVAQKEMPAGSTIVGVDLVPIKPIAGCVGIVADITTERCRQLLRKEIGKAPADVVLHDGAPNVGSAWIADAFTQSGLVLMSLKLATEFLAPGGTFVTKVFRSRDYHPLMWVFQQLFKRVQATKPVSSRDVSAEIFVVCMDYLAPARIDPKLLDPRHVFSEVTDAAPRKLDIFHPEKYTRQREGYEDGDYLQHKKISAEDFVASAAHLDLLATHAEITFPAESWLLARPETTQEIRLLCEDLKVLGKKDFRALIKWRLAMREYQEAQTAAAAGSGSEDEGGDGSEDDDDEDDDEEDDLDALAAGAEAAEAKRKKLLRRKRHAMKEKARKRLAASAAVGDRLPTEEEERLFQLRHVSSEATLAALDEGSWEAAANAGSDDDDDDDSDADDMAAKGPRGGAAGADDDDDDEFDSDDYDAALDRQLERDYAAFLERKGSRVRRVRIGKKTKTLIGTIDGGGEPMDDAALEDATRELGVVDMDVEAAADAKAKKGAAAPRANSNRAKRLAERAADDEATGAKKAHPLLRTETVSKTARADMWFSQSQFAGLLDDDDDDDDEEEKEEKKKKAGTGKAAGSSKAAGAKGKRPADSDDDDDNDEESESEEEDSDAASGADEDDDNLQALGIASAGDKHASDSESSSEEDEDDEDDGSDSDDGGDRSHRKKKQANTSSQVSNLDAEGLALAAEMILRKRKRTVEDGAYNRFTFNDAALPQWFEDGELAHRQPGYIVTKEMAAEIREHNRSVDARPIKKVLEAKARKKHKATRTMEKVTAKASAINDNDTLSEREKVAQIRALFKKAKTTTHQKPTIVVAKRNQAGKRAVRPKGVKGFYRQVDPREKKDLAAHKAKMKTHARGKKGKKGGK